MCLALPGLTEQQANVCEKLPETVESVPFGTKQVGHSDYHGCHGHPRFDHNSDNHICLCTFVQSITLNPCRVLWSASTSSGTIGGIAPTIGTPPGYRPPWKEVFVFVEMFLCISKYDLYHIKIYALKFKYYNVK